VGNQSGKVHLVGIRVIVEATLTSVEQYQYFAVNSEIKDVEKQ